MTIKRFLILVLGLVFTTFITAMGIVESPDGPVSASVLAIFGLLTLILVFGVEIDRIQYGKLQIDFSDKDEK